MEENTAELREELERYRKRYGRFGDIRNLFILKPTWNDIITLLLIIGALVLAYFYNLETGICRETLKNIQSTACQICKDTTSTMLGSLK